MTLLSCAALSSHVALHGSMLELEVSDSVQIFSMILRSLRHLYRPCIIDLFVHRKSNDNFGGLEMLLGYNGIAGGGHSTSLGVMTSLKSLSFRSNELNGSFCGKGPLPASIGHILPNLQYLNMSRNSFQVVFLISIGNIGQLLPGLLTRSSLILLDLSDNSISEKLPDWIGRILKYYFWIDLSMNKLVGPIPPELGFLSDIHTLNLSHNQLNGSIPRTFSNLKQIESLDLSNKLSGGIPQSLLQLNFLSVLSVANNNLSGRAPR
ncbi:hypothetical protein HAX54_010742 [Datura stramonium]|uniref:Uncharacterized protein n=1 Tax=Datura stramonium TaxID=4076 RepID=A0ABS8TJJ1_DATST|nr:hypothetical protein [Datura stramonium]